MPRLRTLGQLHVDGESARALGSPRKALALLAFLVRQPRRTARRAELADLLWGDRDERLARQSLRQALVDLKRVLGDAIAVEAEVVLVPESGVELDADAFAADVAAGRFEAAIARWGGEFLADLDDLGGERYRAWLEAERERLRRLLAVALDEVVGGAECRGDWAGAAAWGERWATLLPLDERGYLRAVRALRVGARPRDALVRHAALMARMTAELGMAPAAELVRLGAELERQARAESKPQAPAPAIATPDLVGRADAFERLAAAWEDARRGVGGVVVLLGPRGAGCTRLADELMSWVRARGEPHIVLAASGRSAGTSAWATARTLLAPLATSPGVAAAPADVLGALAELIPAFRERYAGLDDRSPTPPRLDAAAERVLAEVASESPVLLVVDDVAAADAPSRELAMGIARRPPAGALVVLTATADEWDALPGTREVRAQSSARVVPLPPLSGPDVEVLLASAIHLEAAERHELATRLHAERRSTPLAVLEALYGLVESGVLRADASGVYRHSRGMAVSAEQLAAPAPRLPATRRKAFALVAVAVALATIGTILARARVRRTDAPVTTVAVLPFAVRGGDAYRYLGEGMVTLLSAKLDGAGALRPADARATLGVAEREAGTPADPERGARIAARVGAGTYILGDVVEVDGRLRLQAAAYRGGGEPIAQAGVEGAPADLFALVDSLASGLLPRLSPGPQQLTRLAAATTSSLSALKAYLEGEQLFRAGAFLPAVSAFRRAAADTTFALANYSLSVAGWWADETDLVGVAADRARRHSERLADRDRRLLSAWDTLLHGDTRQAERLYRAILGIEPENVEVWSQLGEVLFHYAPRYGAPIAGSRTAFERVLAFEPGHTSAVLHLARVAGTEGRLADLDSLTLRILRGDSTGDWSLEARPLRAFALGDTVLQARALRELARTSDGRIWNEALYVWLSARNLSGTRRLVALLTDSARAPEVRAFGHVALAFLDVADARPDAMRAELDHAAALDSVMAREHRALLYAFPFVAASPEELRATREDLRAWDAFATPSRLGASHVGGVHDDVHPILREYLIGALSARMGDEPEVRRRAARLAAVEGPPDVIAFARAAGQSLRAQAAWAGGRPADAATLFERALRTETRVTRLGASPFYARGLERYLYAQVLDRLGRRGEADRWYASVHSAPLFNVAFAGPARQARRP